MDNFAESNLPPNGAEVMTGFSQRLEQIALRQHPPLAMLKLAAYATDAFRVLRMLELHASMSTSFDESLRKACPDWRNPGSIDDPADLIAVALVHVITAVQEVFHDLAKLSDAMRASKEAP